MKEEIKEKETIKQVEEPQVNQEQMEEPKMETPFRDKFRGRYKDIEDEESFYQKADSDMDELESYRKENKAFSEALKSNPVLASMLMAAKDGVNPFVWLGQNFGMDIRALADDPTFGEQMAKAMEEYHDKQDEGANYEKQMQESFKTSIDNLKALCEEKKIGEKEATEMYDKFFTEIVEPATRGEVSKDTWALMWKAVKYDSDMDDAVKKAKAQAYNEKIENKLRGQKSAAPSLTSQGTMKEERKKEGFFHGIR